MWKVDVRGSWPILIKGLRAEELRGFSRATANSEAGYRNMKDLWEKAKNDTPRFITDSTFDVDNTLRF